MDGQVKGSKTVWGVTRHWKHGPHTLPHGLYGNCHIRWRLGPQDLTELITRTDADYATTSAKTQVTHIPQNTVSDPSISTVP